MHVLSISSLLMLICSAGGAEQRGPVLLPKTWTVQEARPIELRLVDEDLAGSVRLVVRSHGAQEQVPPASSGPGEPSKWQFTPTAGATYIFAAASEPPDNASKPAPYHYEKLFMRAAPRGPQADSPETAQPSPSATVAFAQRLELIPLVDPTGLHVGDDLPVLVKFEGDELSNATVDLRCQSSEDAAGERPGSTPPGQPDGPRAALRSNESGSVNIQITRAGVWTLSVEHRAAPRQYVATMSFVVAGTPTDK
ncbi:MAG TPA: DUF4198 domain-containing protein [Phycisphaerae bacterium]|jgi:hypothetical protein